MTSLANLHPSTVFQKHNSTFVDGTIHGTSSKPIKSQFPLIQALNLGFDAAQVRSTAGMYQGIDSRGVSKALTEHKSDDRFQVRNEIIHGFQENQVEARSYSVYRLMQINLDKQDLSFVEKVTLLQGEIHNLCNRIVPNSVRRNLGHEKYRLSFS